MCACSSGSYMYFFGCQCLVLAKRHRLHFLHLDGRQVVDDLYVGRSLASNDVIEEYAAYVTHE